MASKVKNKKGEGSDSESDDEEENEKIEGISKKLSTLGGTKPPTATSQRTPKDSANLGSEPNDVLSHSTPKPFETARPSHQSRTLASGLKNSGVTEEETVPQSATGSQLQPGNASANDPTLKNRSSRKSEEDGSQKFQGSYLKEELTPETTKQGSKALQNDNAGSSQKLSGSKSSNTVGLLEENAPPNLGDSKIAESLNAEAAEYGTRDREGSGSEKRGSGEKSKASSRLSKNGQLAPSGSLPGSKRPSNPSSQKQSITNASGQDKTSFLDGSARPSNNYGVPKLEIDKSGSDQGLDKPPEPSGAGSQKDDVPNDSYADEEFEEQDQFPRYSEVSQGTIETMGRPIPKPSMAYTQERGREYMVPYDASIANMEAEPPDSEFDLAETIYRRKSNQTSSNEEQETGIDDNPSFRAQRNSKKDTTKSTHVEMPKGSNHFGGMLPVADKEPSLTDYDIVENKNEPETLGEEGIIEPPTHLDPEQIDEDLEQEAMDAPETSEDRKTGDLDTDGNRIPTHLPTLTKSGGFEGMSQPSGTQPEGTLGQITGETLEAEEPEPKQMGTPGSMPGSSPLTPGSKVSGLQPQTSGSKVSQTEGVSSNTQPKPSWEDGNQSTPKNSGISGQPPGVPSRPSQISKKAPLGSQPQDPTKVSVITSNNRQPESSVSETPKTTQRSSRAKKDPEPTKPAGPTIDELVAQWVKEIPNPASLKKTDDRIYRLQDIATRINKKYARGDFQCRVDFHADRTGRNSVKRPSTYPYELEESGRKVITSTSVFESLELVFEEAIQYVVDNHIDYTNTNFSRNLGEDMENIHYFENQKKKSRKAGSKGSRRSSFQHTESQASDRLRNSLFNADAISQRKSRMSKSSVDLSGNTGFLNDEMSSYCSNTKIMPNQASYKEKDRLKAIFNFVRIQIKHSRMLDTAYFLCLSSNEEFTVQNFWSRYLGNIALQSNFYRTWSLILLERLTEFSFSCESQPLEVGDLLVTLTKSEMYKKIIMDSFGKCIGTPGESMEDFLDTVFPSPGNPPVKDILDKGKLKCCGTYELFLVQYLCHCVYLQRLAILSLPYQILDLLTFSLRTSDRELVNLQEALNESLICLAIANFAHSTQFSRNNFEDLFKSKENPLLTDPQAELDTILFHGEGKMIVGKQEEGEGSITLTDTSLIYFNLKENKPNMLQIEDIDITGDYDFDSPNNKLSLSFANKNSFTRIHLYFNDSPNAKEFKRMWDFLRDTWNTEKGVMTPNGKYRDIGEVDNSSRLVALHLWVNLVPVEIDSINVLKEGIVECDPKDESLCMEHTTLELGFEMLERKICSMIEDPILIEFFEENITFCNKQQEVITIRDVVTFEEIVGSTFADLIRANLKILPKKPKDKGEDSKRSENEKMLVWFLRSEMGHIEKLLNIVNGLKQIKHSRCRSRLTESIISMFRFHCNLAKAIGEAKSRGASITQVFGYMPNLSMVSSCIYTYVDDKRLEDLVILEHWRILEYLAMLEPFLRGALKKPSLAEIMQLKHVFNYLVVNISELVGVMEYVGQVRKYSTGFSQWCINHTTGKMLNRVLRYSSKVVKIEKLDSCQIVTRGKKTITDGDSVPYVIETSTEHPLAFMNIMREGLLVTIGNERFFHARWFMHFKDVKGVAIYFMVHTYQNTIICDSMLRIELKDKSFLSAWATIPPEDAKHSPITYFDYLTQLLLRSKTKFDVKKSSFPDLSTNARMLSTLTRFKDKMNYINQMTQNNKAKEATVLLDEDVKGAVFKSLHRFRRIFLDEFELNFIVDQTSNGRRNENFSLLFNN